MKLKMLPVMILAITLAGLSAAQAASAEGCVADAGRDGAGMEACHDVAIMRDAPAGREAMPEPFISPAPDGTGGEGLIIAPAPLIAAPGRQVVTRADETEREMIIGGDKDEHGCYLMAGYTWCEARQECLRAWEEPCPLAQGTEINSFRACVQAGYPVVESYPRRCRTQEGMMFTEEAEDVALPEEGLSGPVPFAAPRGENPSVAAETPGNVRTPGPLEAFLTAIAAFFRGLFFRA
jgi:hypothetical protein